MPSSNGTVATKAWIKDDYKLRASVDDLELSQFVSFMRAMKVLQNMGELEDMDELESAITGLQGLIADFVERKDGKFITSDEAIWRAGKLKISELKDFFGGTVGAVAVPPQNATS